jgi:hypothetical protein
MNQETPSLIKPGSIVVWYHPLLHRDLIGLVLDEPYMHSAHAMLPNQGDAWFCDVFVEGQKITKEITKDVKVIKTADKNIN